MADAGVNVSCSLPLVGQCTIVRFGLPFYVAYFLLFHVFDYTYLDYPVGSSAPVRHGATNLYTYKQLRNTA